MTINKNQKYNRNIMKIVFLFFVETEERKCGIAIRLDMKKKKVLFISSTGGHLNELQQLSPLFEKYDYHIITEKDDSTKGLKDKYGKRISYLSLLT